MKLLRFSACYWAVKRGNVKSITVMGEVLMDGFLDRSSILLISIPIDRIKAVFFYFRVAFRVA